MVVAALFAMSFAHSALAAENMATFNGEVIAVDSYDKTFTVKPLESIESESMESSAPLTFNWDKMTSVIMCDQNSSIEGIRVGGRVTVTYHEEGGSLIADAINIAPLYLACYDQ
jgi:hypothetical protein